MVQVCKPWKGDGKRGVHFVCPGCDDYHGVQTDPLRWTWNGSLEKPTFSPSLLVTYPANPDAEEDFKEWRVERRCHSFVRDGQIQFLSDCTHSLAGKTVDLPPWPNTGTENGDE